MVPPEINVPERKQCKDDHSEFLLYPRRILNYTTGPVQFLPTATLPEILNTVATMSCVGFKSFVSDSLFGYACACSCTRCADIQ
jgi:hypothetical protein